jgi:DNA-binding transcriptional MerR regulator
VPSPASRHPSRGKGPDAFRTIGEAAAEIGVEPHVLRFWETKFARLKPLTRAGGRRYYRPADIALLHRIKQLLHEDGLTIRGAQKILQGRTPGGLADSAMEETAEASPAPAAADTAAQSYSRSAAAAQTPAATPSIDTQMLLRLAAEARSIANGGPIPPISPTD